MMSPACRERVTDSLVCCGPQMSGDFCVRRVPRLVSCRVGGHMTQLCAGLIGVFSFSLSLVVYQCILSVSLPSLSVFVSVCLCFICMSPSMPLHSSLSQYKPVHLSFYSLSLFFSLFFTPPLSLSLSLSLFLSLSLYSLSAG